MASWVKLPNAVVKDLTREKNAVAQDGKLVKPTDSSFQIVEDHLVVDKDEKGATVTRVRSRFIVDSKGAKRGVIYVQKALVKKGRNGKTEPISVPPNLQITPRTRQVFRYIVNGNQSGATITYGDLLGVAGGICTVVNTTLRLIATSMKILRVTIWPTNGSSGGNPSPAEIGWIGANADQTPDMAYNETLPAGSTIVHPVTSRPPPKSLASEWFDNAVTLADVLFNLTCAQGSILDIEVEYTQPNSLLSTAITIATGTLGVFYYLTLNHSGSKNIYPASLPNTT